MLEVKDICKTYQAKSGVSVRALIDVNLTFPERGMVFLLGKSGSGKSTLLNVIGGLDTFDSGELIIRGRSSMKFRRRDFDAYRNTFIGFIFQEYNILEDFSVGANIGLAMELQGKRATSEDINRILKEVDLEGFGTRNPNELSGGQKQRIAIARALIKDPQIIMADEPTGALDSNTGKQVLETLKKLARDKLVIVVTHDREFAEQYGDRIIELSDGRVISDVSYHEVEENEQNSAGLQIISDTEINVAEGYVLTAEDLNKINAYLAGHKNNVIIHRGKTASNRRSTATDKVETRAYTAEESKFIKGRLPIRKATKMGLSGIKSRPVRFFFTILLSVIAFSLCGFFDTAASYNRMVATAASIRDMDAEHVALSLRLRKRSLQYNDEGELDEENIYYEDYDSFNEEDIKRYEQATGMRFFPAYTGGNGSDSGISLSNNIIDTSKLFNSFNATIFTTQSVGLVEITEADLESLGFKMCEGIPNNRMPAAENEIAISYYVYKMFEVGGYSTKPDDGNRKPETVIGSTIELPIGNDKYPFRIVGVVDTAFNFDKEAYQPLKWNADSDGGYSNSELQEFSNNYSSTIGRSFHTALFAYPGTIKNMPDVTQYDRSITWGARYEGHDVSVGTMQKTDFVSSGDIIEWFVGQETADQFDILWVPGQNKTTLTQNDYIISVKTFAQNAASLQNSSVWNISPLFALREHFTLSSEAYFRGLGEHFALNVETGNYVFAELLSMDNDEYETAMTTELNRIFGLSLVKEQYRAFSLWNYNGSMLNMSGNSFYERFCRELFKVAYDHYDQYKSRLWELEEFRQMLRERKGLGENETVEHFIQSRGFTALQERMYVAELAAEYMMDRYQGWSASNVLGIDIMKIESALAEEIFKNAPASDYSLVFKTNDHTTNNAQYMTRTITGVYVPKKGMGQTRCVISPAFYDIADLSQKTSGNWYFKEYYGSHESGKYATLLAPKPQDEETLNKLVKLHYDEQSDYTPHVESYVMSTLQTVDSFVSDINFILLCVGIGFAIFASLMMVNFISASIVDKKKEIGILRAVGARSRDVFLIFFTEAFFIALINFLLSTGISILAVWGFNTLMRSGLGFDLTLFTFGIRQILLLLGVSILVALISSFFPTNTIARKQPVDAMRGR